MSIQQKEFIRFLKLLSDNDLLQHVVLIGSWAEFIYKETGILPGFDANIRTLDIDFLLKNLRKPMPPKNMVALAKDAGYMVESDLIDGTTRILDKEGLEIEFLINKMGAGLEETLKTNLGVTAQALRHLGIINKNTMELDYLGFIITVPKPEAYAIHKIVINPERKAKQEKDAEAVKNIWPYLDKEECNRIIESLSKKEKSRVDSFIQKFDM